MAAIIITIADGGATEIKVQGCAGPSCQSLTESIEKALGVKTADAKTHEYHAAVTQGQRAQAGAK